MNGTLQQRYLSMMARLYELAGTFSEAELRRLSSSLSESGDYNALRAVELLSRLHNSIEDGLVQPHETAEDGRSTYAESRSSSLDDGDTPLVASPKALERLLSDATLFPGVREISRAFPSVKLRPKEGRDRYIRRVVAAFEVMSPRERSASVSRITENLAHVPEGFLSRWKKLIKDM
jgi:hypothetical protein